MTAFHENHSSILEANLRDTLQDGAAPDGNIVNSTNGTSSPYNREEDLQSVVDVQLQENEPNADIAFGEDRDVNSTSNYKLSSGPGDEDDDDDDDDDEFLDDEDDTLIPIEGDEEDDDGLLSADEDEDVIPGTDLDDDDLDDDDDDDDEDSTVNRSTLGDIGSSNTSRDAGRTSGRMIDHEPGTSDL